MKGHGYYEPLTVVARIELRAGSIGEGILATPIFKVKVIRQSMNAYVDRLGKRYPDAKSIEVHTLRRSLDPFNTLTLLH